MDTVIKVVQATVAIAGLLVLAASIVAFYRVNLAKSQIEALRGDRDDLDKRVKRQDEEIDALKKAKQSQDSIIRAQNEKIKVLEKVVTGKEQLDHLQVQLDTLGEQFNNHDKRVDNRHEELSAAMVSLLNSHKDLLKTLQVSK